MALRLAERLRGRTHARRYTARPLDREALRGEQERTSPENSAGTGSAEIRRATWGGGRDEVQRQRDW